MEGGTLSGHVRERGTSKRQSTGRYCQMRIAIDHLFLRNVAGGSESVAISEVASAFSEVQNIYQTTDFDDNGSPDFILPQLVQTEDDLPGHCTMEKWSFMKDAACGVIYSVHKVCKK